MKIAVIQTDIIWESPNDNYNNIQEQIKNIDKVDLLVLPEMFSTGFSMDSKRISENNKAKTFTWMKNLAENKNISIIGSIATKENNKYFNRLYYIKASGEYQHYDKRHLFRMANEQQHYSMGKERIIIQEKDFNICPLICYDLRFPVFSRNTFIKSSFSFDCLIYIANWPKARVSAWTSLLKARAIENQVYVIGVNRVGTDGNGIEYNGRSRIFDFKGDRIDSFQDNTKQVQIIDMNKEKLNRYRRKFPAHLDADEFKLKSPLE